MKESDVPKLIELIMAEAAACCQVEVDEFNNSSSRSPNIVEARRLVTFTLREKLGFKALAITKALHLKGSASVYGLLNVAKKTYGVDKPECRGFTDAVDDIMKKVLSKFGTLQEIAAVIGSGKVKKTEAASAKTRGPKRRGKTPRVPRSPKALVPETSPVNGSLAAVVYALSQVDGLSPQNLADAFDISVPEVERTVGQAVLALRHDSPAISRGIERIRAILGKDLSAKE